MNKQSAPDAHKETTLRTLNDNTEKMGQALEFAAREYGKHSGPQSDERERATFARDVRVAALRFARAYYAEARDLGLIPEYERVSQHANQAE